MAGLRPAGKLKHAPPMKRSRLEMAKLQSVEKKASAGGLRHIA